MKSNWLLNSPLLTSPMIIWDRGENMTFGFLLILISARRLVMSSMLGWILSDSRSFTHFLLLKGKNTWLIGTRPFYVYSSLDGSISWVFGMSGFGAYSFKGSKFCSLNSFSTGIWKFVCIRSLVLMASVSDESPIPPPKATTAITTIHRNKNLPMFEAESSLPNLIKKDYSWLF